MPFRPASFDYLYCLTATATLSLPMHTALFLFKSLFLSVSVRFPLALYIFFLHCFTTICPFACRSTVLLSNSSCSLPPCLVFLTLCIHALLSGHLFVSPCLPVTSLFARIVSCSFLLLVLSCFPCSVCPRLLRLVHSSHVHQRLLYILSGSRSCVSNLILPSPHPPYLLYGLSVFVLWVRSLGVSVVLPHGSPTGHEQRLGAVGGAGRSGFTSKVWWEGGEWRAGEGPIPLLP